MIEKYLDDIEEYIIITNPHCLNKITNEYNINILEIFFKLKYEIKNCKNKINELEQVIEEITNKNFDV